MRCSASLPRIISTSTPIEQCKYENGTGKPPVPFFDTHRKSQVPPHVLAASIESVGRGAHCAAVSDEGALRMRHTPCGYTPPCAGTADRIRRGVVSTPVNRAEIYGIAAKQKLPSAGLGKPALRCERKCLQRAPKRCPYDVERWYFRLLPVGGGVLDAPLPALSIESVGRGAHTPPRAGSTDRIRRGVVSTPVNRAEIYGIAAKQKLPSAGLGKPVLRGER